MNFSVTVPNATQSPGLFPAQNNTNFSRLKDNINNDHNFLDTAGAAQGIHRQVTLINRATPVGLTAGNGIVYSKADSFGASQVFWYNGSSDVQITPGVQVLVGTVTLNPLATSVIFPDPGYLYQLYWFEGSGGLFNKTGIAVLHASGRFITSNSGFVEIEYTGNDIQLRNTSNSVIFTVTWTLEIIRTS